MTGFDFRALPEHDQLTITTELNTVIRSEREPEIENHLSVLLRVVTGSEWIPQYRSNEVYGTPDLVCLDRNTVIEVKSRGEAGPDLPGGRDRSDGSGKITQLEQLRGYLRDLSGGRKPGLFGGGTKRWFGALTDGVVWWTYRYDPINDDIWLGVDTFGAPTTAESFMVFVLTEVVGSQGGQRPSPPSDAVSTALKAAVTATYRYQMKAEKDAGYVTKRKLWSRLLLGAGIVPPAVQSRGHDNAFATHSLLTVASRILVASIEGEWATPSEFARRDDIYEGFCGWLGQDSEGRAIVESVAESLLRYDWSKNQRDVLKEAYHMLIPREQRKEFGEYYTPDDLAEIVVASVLTDPILDRSIRAATAALDGEGDDRAIAFLDPACGSGTFLLHIARRTYDRIRQAHKSDLHRAREIVAWLVRGIDVHPVAVEMARATLASAMPRGGSRVSLQVTLADSMASVEHDDVFDAMEGMLVRSVYGDEIRLPRDFVRHPEFNEWIRRLVESAASGNPPARFPELSEEDQKLLIVTEKILAGIIEAEKDHVWAWYITNRAAVTRLRDRKVAALIGNPPWLVANDTPEGSRKKRVAQLRDEYGLKPPRYSSALGDLASVFVSRVTHLYADSSSVFGWVLPGTALTGQTWAAWRKGGWGPTAVAFKEGWDLNDLEPSVFDHAPNGTCVVLGKVSTQGEALPDGGTTVWAGKLETAVIEQTPSRPSLGPVRYYGDKFHRGATATPTGLILTLDDPAKALRVSAEAEVVRVQTKRSSKGNWKGITQTLDIERDALLPVCRSQAIVPFTFTLDAWLVAPTNDAKSRLLTVSEMYLSRPLAARYFDSVEPLYNEHRTSTAGKTLRDNLDWKGTLSRQLPAVGSQRTKVMYNKSGTYIRAVRTTRSVVAFDTIYYYMASSEDEAIYLVGILNADALQAIWRATKTSKQHFDLNPLKKVAIPKWDGNDAKHRAIAEIGELLELSPNKQSLRAQLDAAVSELLPDYATV